MPHDPNSAPEVRLTEAAIWVSGKARAFFRLMVLPALTPFLLFAAMLAVQQGHETDAAGFMVWAAACNVIQAIMTDTRALEVEQGSLERDLRSLEREAGRQALSTQERGHGG